jgi:hypothetical protein
MVVELMLMRTVHQDCLLHTRALLPYPVSSKSDSICSTLYIYIITVKTKHTTERTKGVFGTDLLHKL